MGSGKLIRRMQKLLKEKGKTAYEIAKKEIFRESFYYKPVREALHYFIGEYWCNFHHPALISLTCEAVGGKGERTENVGAALVLLTGAVDIHDDILDRSKVKESKPTVFGIFGQDIALVVGNILLIKGLQLLNKACDELPRERGEEIFNIVKNGFLELGMGVAREMSLKGRWDIAPEEYFEVIKSKAAIAEAAAKIGAVLGGGARSEINSMARYGKVLGILATIRDDFIDMFEPDELLNRAKNECLPLPLLYALKNLEVRKEITELLKKEFLSEEDASMVIEAVMKAEEIQELRNLMKTLLQNGIRQVNFVKDKNILQRLVNILVATTEDLL